jgi:hypothetical protein
VANVAAGSWFLIVVVVGMAVGIGSLILRQRRESPTRDWVREQPVLFEARAAILIHARGMQGNGWGTLKGRGWPRLVVHLGGIEATIGGFGDGLVSGNTMLTEGATMRRERLSAFPIVAGDRDCIRLMGNDGHGQPAPANGRFRLATLRSMSCGLSSLPLALLQLPSASTE